ncbi:MAG: NUDIX hydrolase [Leptolyngbya sp. SIO4C1]|nr:NUDIX hydrolase [Leptolyngbya sp. SIO4C1]
MTFGQEPPQLIKQRLAYAGRKFSFEINHLKLPNGAIGDWECIRHPGGAVAVPVTADGALVLVRQYRFAVRGRLLEFPAGTLEAGETPLATIQRELEEETGYSASQWQPLGKFPLAPGYSDEIIYTFLATQLEQLAVQPELDADEDIEVVLMSPAEFEKAMFSSEPIDAKSIASYWMAKPLFD